MEMAIAAPILILMLFATIEMGLIIRANTRMHTLAQLAGRMAARGLTTTAIENSMSGTNIRLDSQQLTTTYEKKPYNETSGSYGSWTTLGNGSSENNAESGDRIRVTVTYNHGLVSGGLIPGLVDDQQNNTMELEASIIVRRE